MSHWQTSSLGARTVNHDSRRVPVRSVDRKPGPFPYYGASGIVDYVDGFLFDGLHLLVAEDGENLRSRKTAIAFLADGKFWVNNHAHILQGDEDNDTRFLAYALEAVDVSGYLSGSTQPKLTQRALAMIPIYAPGLTEQQGIAQTIRALDDLVHSKLRTIELAGSILDSVIDLHAPALPTVPLSELATRTSTLCDPSSLGDTYVDHYSLPAFDAWRWPEQVPATSIMSNKIKLVEPTILVSRLNPRFNRTWWAAPRNDVPALASTEFSALTPQPGEPLACLWLAVRAHAFRDELPRRVTGTSGSHQRVRPDDMLAIEVPDTRSLSPDVAETALALLNIAHAYRAQIASITELRDVLAPELLSGRIRVVADGGAGGATA